MSLFLAMGNGGPTYLVVPRFKGIHPAHPITLVSSLLEEGYLGTRPYKL